jgi:hypothetical protein
MWEMHRTTCPVMKAFRGICKMFINTVLFFLQFFKRKKNIDRNFRWDCHRRGVNEATLFFPNNNGAVRDDNTQLHYHILTPTPTQTQQFVLKKPNLRSSAIYRDPGTANLPLQRAVKRGLYLPHVPNSVSGRFRHI